MANQQPVERFRAGSVSGALWANEISIKGQQRTIMKTSLDRRYQDKDGNWRSSQSFSRAEIPLAIYCLIRAFEWMIQKEQDSDSTDAVEEVVID